MIHFKAFGCKYVILNLLLVVTVFASLSGIVYVYAADQTDYTPSLTGIQELNISQLPPVITWNAVGMPLPYTPQDESRIVSAIERSFEIWEEHNPEMNFKKVNGHADILVKWHTVPSSGSGTAEPDGNHGGRIVISIGDLDCRGAYNERPSNRLINVMMHEIGHIFLGTDHHKAWNHLMYGTHPPPSDGPYDTRGYNIPDRLSTSYFFIEQKPLYDKLDELDTIVIGINNPNTDKVVQAALDRIEESRLIINKELDCFAGDPTEYEQSEVTMALLDVDIALNVLKIAMLQDRVAELDSHTSTDTAVIKNRVNDLETRTTALENAINTLETGLAAIQKQISDFNKTINDLLNRVLRIDNTSPPTGKPVTLNISAWNDSDGDGIRDIGETAAPNILIITSIVETRQSNLLYTGIDGTISIDDFTAETFYAIAVPPDGKTASTHPFEFGNSTIYGVLKVDDPAPDSTYTMNVGIK